MIRPENTLLVVSSVLYQSWIDPPGLCNSTLQLLSLKGFSLLQTASGLSAGRKPMILPYNESVERGGVYVVCLVCLFQNISRYVLWEHIFKAKPVCLVRFSSLT